MDQEYQVTKNVFYNFIGQAILLMLGLIATPFIIHQLGNDLYGVYSIVLVVVGYFAILDLGLGQSIIKYISEYHAKSETKTLEKVINTSLVVYLFIGSIGALLIIALTQTLATGLLNIPSSLIPLVISVFYISSLGFFVNMVLTVFNSIPSGLQRMDITNSRNILFGIMNTTGTVILLSLGQGLIAVMIWNVVTSLIATIVFLRLIFKLLPNISIKLQFDRDIFLRLVRFSSFKFISNIAGQLVFQFDRLLIGFLNPISAVTFYTVPALLVQKGLAVIFNITSAVFPALSKSYALDDNQRVKQLYLKMTKFTIFLICPIMSLLFIFSDSILTVWVGKEFALQSGLALKILAAAYFLAAASSSGVVAADAFGAPELSAKFALISAIINFAAMIILVPRFGINGAALALLINFSAMVPLFLVIVNKKIIKISNWDFLKVGYIKPVLASLLAGTSSYYLTSFYPGDLIKIVVGFGIFGIIYILTNILFKTFDIQDQRAFFYLINKLRRI